RAGGAVPRGAGAGRPAGPGSGGPPVARRVAVADGDHRGARPARPHARGVGGPPDRTRPDRSTRPRGPHGQRGARVMRRGWRWVAVVGCLMGAGCAAHPDPYLSPATARSGVLDDETIGRLASGGWLGLRSARLITGNDDAFRS